MPLVRVHKASDGKLFENYDDYAIHQEGVNFQKAWEEEFGDNFFSDKEAEANFKLFTEHNKDALVEIIEKSKVKRKGKPAKK